MSLFLYNPSQIIAAEVFSGFGKSYVINIMAQYLANKDPEIKILMLEPNPALRYYHEEECPLA